jgi:hypothetical protein
LPRIILELPHHLVTRLLDSILVQGSLEISPGKLATFLLA